MNISISLSDLYAIATYGYLVGSANLTEYPHIIDAIKITDPDEKEYVIRNCYGKEEFFSVDEWIHYKKQSDAFDKWLAEQKNKPAAILQSQIQQSTMDKVQALDPELAEMLRRQQG